MLLLFFNFRIIFSIHCHAHTQCGHTTNTWWKAGLAEYAEARPVKGAEWFCASSTVGGAVFLLTCLLANRGYFPVAAKQASFPSFESTAILELKKLNLKSDAKRGLKPLLTLFPVAGPCEAARLQSAKTSAKIVWRFMLYVKLFCCLTARKMPALAFMLCFMLVVRPRS